MANEKDIREWDLSLGMIESHIGQKFSGHMTPHFHPHYELICVTKGIRSFLISDRRYHARAGDLIIFRPGVIHEEWLSTKANSIITLRFMPERVPGVGIPEELGPVIKLPFKERFLDIFSRIQAERQRQDDGHEEMVGAYLLEFVVMMRRAAKYILRNGRGDEIQQKNDDSSVIDLVRGSLSKPIKLAAIASQVFRSVSSVSRAFKKATGEPPRHYLISRRIAQAKKMLAGTSLPAKEIAAKLGYDNQYFFYRQFKAKVGVTANQYRAKAKKCIRK